MHIRRSLLAAVSALALVAAGAVAVDTATAPPAAALDNGLALTPPMGFNNWNSTHCRADFNESMVEGIADLFVSKGLKDAGYQYVNLDDCWALPQRDADGNLVPDPVRFPHGIKAVADYVHSKGLKLGIYTSAGTKTCNTAGFPGGLGHEQQDANLFASWGVDYLKYDNCNNQGVDAQKRYTAMRDALANTGRPITFSICEWGQNKPWLWASDVGNLWRTTGDISDSYSSMVNIFHQNVQLAQYAGPGHWNDPDMLEVGNGGMTDTEYRSHFSLWSIMAAPLLIGSDLRKDSDATFDIVLNKDVIAVDQDPLGKQGTVVSSENGHWVIAKPLADGDVAVALFNEGDAPATISTTAAAAGLPDAPAYRLRNLWTHKTTETAGQVTATVPAHGTVMYRVGKDNRWALYPPAVDSAVSLDTPYPGASAVVTPGATSTVQSSVANYGLLPALDVHTTLTGPDGWTIKPSGSTWRPALTTNKSFSTDWQVSVPADAQVGSYTLDLKESHLSGSTDRQLTVVVANPPPSGTTQLSDVPWLHAANGYGPVEKDTSNGESKAGDGHTITIQGQTWSKGLGTNAPSTIEYYTAKKCSTVHSFVGVDDEKTANGSVTFEIWADGTKVADSGLLTVADPAKELTADVSGATLVRLIVTDGGNGNNSDHGDWASPTITCS
jgi:alpha-galactosidase